MKTSTMLLLAAAAGGGYLLYRRSQNTADAAAAAPVVSTTPPISTPTGAAMPFPTGILSGILGALKPGAQILIKEKGNGVLSPPIMPTRPEMVAGTLGDHTLKCGRNGTLS